MHLSDRRSYLRSEHLGPCARARAKNPHIFKKQAEEKKERRKKITRTFHRSDSNRRRSNFGGRSRRSNGRGGTDHGGSCLRGGEHFFFSLLSDTEKRSARGEYDAFFFERESFSMSVSIDSMIVPKQESRERFFALQKTLFVLSRPRKRDHTFCFLFLLFFIVPISGTQNTKNSKKKFNTLFSVLLLTSLHKQTRAQVYNHELLLLQTLSLSAFGEIEEEEEEELYTHTHRE
jgi:hypothetical protein